MPENALKDNDTVSNLCIFADSMDLSKGLEKLKG